MWGRTKRLMRLGGSLPVDETYADLTDLELRGSGEMPRGEQLMIRSENGSVDHPSKSYVSQVFGALSLGVARSLTSHISRPRPDTTLNT